MAPRPSVPAEDLYAQLDVPVDASPEAIEIAWRGLLRQHHPDVAGPASLERAKRINVAHDWLSDPGLRARYDRERGPDRRPVLEPAHPRRHQPEPTTGGTPARPGPVRRPTDEAEATTRFLARVARLTSDELDRLAAADPAPIAFGATIRRFLPLERRAALELVEAEIERRLASGARDDARIRDVLEAYAAELVLGSFLDDLLTEPFRERTRERLTRGWDAAVGQPRYGPNGVSVEALLDRLRGLDGPGMTRLAATGTRERLGDEPWPPDVTADDDEALRISSLLAARDAAAALPRFALDEAVANRARRAAARLAHLVVMRHAFPAATYAALTAPWRPALVPDDRLAARVRRPP